MPKNAGFASPKHAPLKGHFSTPLVRHRDQPKSTFVSFNLLRATSPLQDIPSGHASQLHSVLFRLSSRYWLSVQSMAVIQEGFSHDVAFVFAIFPDGQCLQLVPPRESAKRPGAHAIQNPGRKRSPCFPRSQVSQDAAPA